VAAVEADEYQPDLSVRLTLATITKIAQMNASNGTGGCLSKGLAYPASASLTRESHGV